MQPQAIPTSQLYVRSQLRRYRVANADEIVEAARLVAGQRMKRGASFLNPAESGRFFVDKLAGLEREVFVAAFLDTRHRLIEYIELFARHHRRGRGASTGSGSASTPLQCRSRDRGP